MRVVYGPWHRVYAGQNVRVVTVVSVTVVVVVFAKFWQRVKGKNAKRTEYLILNIVVRV